jgi:hypothetical protein
MSNVNLSGDDVISAIYEMVEELIDNKQHCIVQGTWNYAEDVDSDLSSVTIEGLEYKFVRKLDHVTGLTNGDALLLLRSPECTLTIIGKIIGNITLASII